MKIVRKNLDFSPKRMHFFQILTFSTRQDQKMVLLKKKSKTLELQLLRVWKKNRRDLLGLDGIFGELECCSSLIAADFLADWDAASWRPTVRRWKMIFIPSQKKLLWVIMIKSWRYSGHSLEGYVEVRPTLLANLKVKWIRGTSIEYPNRI